MASQRRAFSLIEWMVVIALISLSMGMLTFGSPRVFSHYAFTQSCDKLQSTLLKAKALSEQFESPLRVLIEKNSAGFFVQIQTQPWMPERWKRMLGKKYPLPYIETLVIDEKPVTGPFFLSFEELFGEACSHTLVAQGKHREKTMKLEGYTSSFKESSHAHYPKEIG